MDIYNNLYVAHDVSFDKHLSVLDASFQRDVQIYGDLEVNEDVSFNKHLSVPDASFQNNVDIVNTLTVHNDVSVNNMLKVADVSVGTIHALNNEKILIADDVSLNAKLSGTDASFDNIQVHKIFGNSPIEIEDDVSFNGDICCNNIIFTVYIYSI